MSTTWTGNCRQFATYCTGSCRNGDDWTGSRRAGDVMNRFSSRSSDALDRKLSSLRQFVSGSYGIRDVLERKPWDLCRLRPEVLELATTEPEDIRPARTSSSSSSSASFYLPNSTTVCTSTSVPLRRAGRTATSWSGSRRGRRLAGRTWTTRRSDARSRVAASARTPATRTDSVCAGHVTTTTTTSRAVSGRARRAAGEPVVYRGGRWWRCRLQVLASLSFRRHRASSQQRRLSTAGSTPACNAPHTMIAESILEGSVIDYRK